MYKHTADEDVSLVVKERMKSSCSTLVAFCWREIRPEETDKPRCRKFSTQACTLHVCTSLCVYCMLRCCTFVWPPPQDIHLSCGPRRQRRLMHTASVWPRALPRDNIMGFPLWTGLHAVSSWSCSPCAACCCIAVGSCQQVLTLPRPDRLRKSFLQSLENHSDYGGGGKRS